MKKIKIKLGRKEINLELREMRGINKFLGLMIYRDNLLFNFEKGKQFIHSLFCPKFIAIWLDEGKIVDIKLIKPWRLSIKPEKEFDKLIEIPIIHCNYSIVKPLLEFIDERRKV